MSTAELNQLGTELINIAVNPDRLRALLTIVNADDPASLDVFRDAIDESGMSRNL